MEGALILCVARFIHSQPLLWEVGMGIPLAIRLLYDPQRSCPSLGGSVQAVGKIPCTWKLIT